MMSAIGKIILKYVFLTVMMTCYGFTAISAHETSIFSTTTTCDTNASESNATDDNDTINDDQIHYPNPIHVMLHEEIFLTMVIGIEKISSSFSSIWLPPKL